MLGALLPDPQLDVRLAERSLQLLDLVEPTAAHAAFGPGEPFSASPACQTRETAASSSRSTARSPCHGAPLPRSTSPRLMTARTSRYLSSIEKTEGRATSCSLHEEPDTNPHARIRDAGHDNWPPTRQTPDTNGGETERGKSPSPAPLARGAADDAANIIRDQDRATRDRQTTPAMAADNPPTTHDSKLTDNRVRIKTAHDDRNIQLTGYVLLNPPRRSNPDNQLRCIEDNTRHHLGRRGRSRQRLSRPRNSRSSNAPSPSAIKSDPSTGWLRGSNATDCPKLTVRQR